MNLIDEYVDMVRNYTDAPHVFVEASAYHLISNLLGRFTRTTYLRGHGKPNLWFILSSIPGRMRRSTVIGLSKRAYKKALYEYFLEVLKWKPELANEKVFGSIIEEGTPEGIMDNIEETNLDSYAIINSEFGIVLQKIATKGYEFGVSTLFSKLYDGEGGAVYLSKRTKRERLRVVPDGLFTTMLCGMQEPNLYITPNMVRQGLLRRIILIYVKPEDLNEWKPLYEMNLSQVYDEIDEYAKKLYDKMKYFKELSSEYFPFNILVAFMPSVVNKLNEYGKQIDEEIRNNPEGLISIHKQDYALHLGKLAVVRAIGRGNIQQLGDNYVITVTEDDFNKAKDFLTRATKNIDEAIMSLGEVRLPITTASEPIERIYNIIKNKGKISRKELYRLAKMTASELNEILSTLTLQGRITTEVEKISFRPTTYYKVIDEKE